MSNQLPEKKKRLEQLIQTWPSALVAYSGGVDSAFLLWTAHQILGSKVTGILGDSASLPRSEHQAALNFAQKYGLPVQVLSTQELQDPSYASNPPNRCFFCRSELFQKMEALALSRKVAVLAYGENYDDSQEVRPGQSAAQQFRVAAPLREAGLTKAEVRTLAKEAGLSVAEKPASPCLSSRLAPGLAVTPQRLASIEKAEELSSRLAPGLAVTPQRLASIEKAEELVRSHGFRIVRVRHLGEKALVQVSPDETHRLSEPSLQAKLTPALTAAGFSSVEFDSVGYQGAGLR